MKQKSLYNRLLFTISNLNLGSILFNEIFVIILSKEKVFKINFHTCHCYCEKKVFLGDCFAFLYLR